MNLKTPTHFFTWVYQTTDIEEGNNFDVKLYHQRSQSQSHNDYNYFCKKYKSDKRALIIEFKVTTDLSLDELDISHADIERLDGYEELNRFDNEKERGKKWLKNY